MRSTIILSGLIALLLLTCIGGCGYRFSGEGQGPQPGLKAIAIPVFENKTSEPDLGAIFAGALRQEFIRRGSMRVVPLQETDVVMRGKITNIYASGMGHINFEETILSRIYVTLNIRCEDTRQGKVLWQDPEFTYHRVFVQATDGLVAFQNRRDALQVLAREMAERIHDRFLNDF